MAVCSFTEREMQAELGIIQDAGCSIGIFILYLTASTLILLNSWIVQQRPSIITVDTIHIQQNMERNTSKGIDDFYLASFNGTRGGCGDNEEGDTCEGSHGEALLAALDRST